MTHDADALPYKRSRKAQIVLAAYHMRRRRARMRDREICVMLTADEQRELLIALGSEIARQREYVKTVRGLHNGTMTKTVTAIRTLGRARCKLLDAILPLGGADV